MSKPNEASSDTSLPKVFNRVAWQRDYARKRRATIKEDPALLDAHNKYQKDYLRTRHRASKKKAVEYMGGKCSDCAGTYHQAVYDFHHNDPNEKDLKPSAALLGKWEKARAELDKCVMLCANCHRLRHYAEEQQLN